MRVVFAWSCVLACALVLVAPAGSSTVPVAKARAVAAKRLFAYVWSLSYVTDFQVTDCTTSTGGSVSCGYDIAFYGAPSCTGTIVVESVGRSVRSRFTGDLCTGPPPPAPVPAPAPTPTTPITTTPIVTTAPETTPTVTIPTTTSPGTTTGTSTTTATTTTTTSQPPAYNGVGGLHSLDSISGSTVTLDDGSSWQVYGSVSTWVYDDVIEVAYANGKYTLTDDADGTSVTATYIG